MDAVQCGTPGKDIQFFNGFPSQKCTEQSPQPKDVIEMSVREQDLCEIFETRSRLQYLSLRALATIHKKTIFIMFYDLCRESAVCRGRRGRSAEKKYFEQSDLYFLTTGANKPAIVVYHCAQGDI